MDVHDQSSQATPPNNYFIDPGLGSEVVRLLEQDRLFNEQMGPDLFPTSGIDLNTIYHVLDIACGPGGWALQVASNYPDTHVVGIDVSPQMIHLARSTAKAQKLNNITFLVMDATNLEELEDNGFDFVNARMINAFLKPDQWPGIIAQMLRVTRPGGYIRLTESILIDTNSDVSRRLYDITFRALQREGRPYYTNAQGKIVDIGEQLPTLLTEAGATLLGTRLHEMDWSWNTKEHQIVYRDALILTQLLRPLVLKGQEVDAATYDNLSERLAVELNQPSLKGIWTFQSAWAQKPASTSSNQKPGQSAT